MATDLLCSSKVVLPSFRESIWRKSLDQRIRNLYREKLIGIWKPIFSLTNMYQNFEKTKGDDPIGIGYVDPTGVYATARLPVRHLFPLGLRDCIRSP